MQSGGDVVEGSGEADLESFDFTEPAFALGEVEAVGLIVSDLVESAAWGGVGPEHRATDATVKIAGRRRFLLPNPGQRAELRVGGHGGRADAACRQHVGPAD
jgi:hypothetical protein